MKSSRDHNVKRTIVLLACMLACTSAGFAQNLLTNGSFEKPTVPVGSYTVFPVGGPPFIPGWTVVGNPGTNVFIGSTTLCDAGPPTTCYPAQDRQQFLDLTGAGSNDMSEGVEQTVTLTPGDYYQLSYWVGNVSIGGAYGTTSTANVYINDTFITPHIPLYADTNSMTSPLVSGIYYQVWQQFIHVFQATTASTTIKFLNGDPSTDGINGLDNVVLLHICKCPQKRQTNDEAADASCADAKVDTNSKRSDLIAN